MLGEHLIEQIADALDQPALEPRISAVYGIVRRAEEYLETHAHRTIYLHELSLAVGVSGRGLRYAFEHVLDISPNQYLTLLRLHRARSLLGEEGNARSVKEAALLTGHNHFPRFAIHYRRLFGEKPSETLQRRLVGGAHAMKKDVHTKSAVAA